MKVTEESAKRIRSLMARDKLGIAQVNEVFDRSNLTREIPPADGTDDEGEMLWLPQTIRDAASEPNTLHVRGRAPATIQHRKATLERVEEVRQRKGGPKTWNPDSRTFVAIVATETPSTVFNFEHGDFIDEILLADGGNIPERFPLLADHERATRAVVGSAFDPRREGTDWVATCELADNDRADEIADLIEGGHVDAVSIGYMVGESTLVRSGTEATIAGRTFYNDSNRPLMIAIKWQVVELSIVPIGADPTARIRSHFSGDRAMPVPAIHSRQSVTGRPSLGALISGMMLRAGVSDPSQYRVTEDRGGGLVRIASGPQTVRDAEQGEAYSIGSPLVAIRAACEMDGVQFANHNPSTMMRQVQQFVNDSRVQGRAMGGSNLATLFQNTFASLLLAAHDAAGDSTRGWIQESDNLTYQPQPRNRLSAAELTHHPRGGAAEELDIEVVAEDTQVARYSAKFTVDETDLVNANAVGSGIIEASIPKQLGDAAGALKANLVYAALLTNPAMHDGLELFHADHGNLIGTAALSDATLGAAMRALSIQRENNVALNLRGDYLIVPPTLERAAAKLIREVDLLDSEATRPAIVRVESRLENGLKHPRTGEVLAGSAANWFMASSAAGHGLEVQYLAGSNRAPRIDMWFLERGDFGVCFGVQHSLGVSPIGWRGLVKNVAE